MNLTVSETEDIKIPLLKGFQAFSTQATLLDMDLTEVFDLRPPLSPSSPSTWKETGFQDSLTIQQLSKMM